MKRIAIIGMSGSGKTTFANKLAKVLNLEVTHLDKEYWTKDWKEKYSKEEWVNFEKELIKKDSWIIDGNYSSTQDIRFERADAIIFFDLPKIICFTRVLRRYFKSGEISDKVEGAKENVTWGMLRYIIKYPSQRIRNFVAKHHLQGKTVYIFKSIKESQKFLVELAVK